MQTRLMAFQEGRGQPWTVHYNSGLLQLGHCIGQTWIHPTDGVAWAASTAASSTGNLQGTAQLLLRVRKVSRLFVWEILDHGSTGWGPWTWTFKVYACAAKLRPSAKSDAKTCWNNSQKNLVHGISWHTVFKAHDSGLVSNSAIVVVCFSFWIHFANLFTFREHLLQTFSCPRCPGLNLLQHQMPHPNSGKAPQITAGSPQNSPIKLEFPS